LGPAVFVGPKAVYKRVVRNARFRTTVHSPALRDKLTACHAGAWTTHAYFARV